MISSKKNKLLLLIPVLLIAIATLAYSMMYKPHKTTEEQDAVFTGAVGDFQNQLNMDAQKWQNAIVELNGPVTEIDGKGVMLNGNSYCQFSEPAQLSGIQQNQQIKIKGRFIGYDELLEEIKLDQCILVKN